MVNFDTILYKNIMTIQLDTQESSKHLMRSKSITGGQVYKSSSKTMYKDAEHANNSK